MQKLTPATTHSVYERYTVGKGLPLVVDLAQSRGAFLHDSLQDKFFLDFISCGGARALSYNHAKLCDPAFLEELHAAALHKLNHVHIYSVPYAEALATLATTALAGTYPHVMLTSGAAAALDAAVQMTFAWKTRRNERAGRMLSFCGAYHGRTGTAMLMSEGLQATCRLPLAGVRWPKASNPSLTFPLDLAEMQRREARALEEVEAAFAAPPHDIAGIIVEPIQGEGGDHHFSSAFLQALEAAARAHDALLIFDEVQTGFGSTGTWFNYEQHGVVPDLLLFGYKAGITGVAAGPRLDERGPWATEPACLFGGAMVDMVRCKKVIEIICEDALLDNVNVMGDYLLRVLQDLAGQFPAMTQVRGRGTWAAFNMPSFELRDKLIEACFAEELLVAPSGACGVRLRTPLDLDADAAGRAGAQLEAGMRRAFADAR